MSTLLLPDTRPSLNRVRAIVTTKWGQAGYRPIVVSSLENYYVDTAIDTDADTWQVVIGDPYGEFLDMLKRDSEVRLQLFGVGQEATNFLVTGIADEIEYDEEGSVVVTGRDLSSLAIDSTVPPHRFQHVRAYSVVAQQARQLGFQQTNLARQPMVKKLEVTDGNESYWEFWYRLYRKEKMFLWTDPNGTLNGGPLNSGYGTAPTYFFGRPKAEDDVRIKRAYIPVERVAIRKSTQQRVWQVWVYGQKGDNGFREISEDSTISDWIKKPIKIMQDTDAHTPTSARKLGWQEIYEGKVGSIEVTLTIPDPGFAIRTNRIAVVRVPEIGFSGDFYVVGVRYQGGPDGFVQEIRLRERLFALSRRSPADPKIQNTTEPPRASDVVDSLAQGLASGTGMPQAWAPYFVKAAKEWHGPWDYSLFLATLIAIADQETSFRNIRANGGPGGSGITWYPWQVERTGPTYGEAIGEALFGPNPKVKVPDKGVAIDRFKRTRSEYETIFANEPGQYVNSTFAVGPMQLYSLGYKQWADDHFKPGFRDEYEGGRWNIESNIWAGARALRDKLQSSVGDTGKDADMWAGVSHYGHHYADEGPNTVPTKYAVSVKNKVYNDPGYLNDVNKLLQSARETAKAAKDNNSEPVFGDDQISGDPSLPSLAEVKKFWQINHISTGFNTVAEKRRAIVMCAMWGYYNRGNMHYSMGTPHESEGRSDFGAPPNYPSWTDCSGFAEWCYLSGSAPDPGSWTGAQWNNTRGKSISPAQLQPGDLIFYADPNQRSGHVVVYVGFGKLVSFGQEDGPSLYEVAKYRTGEIAGYRSFFAAEKPTSAANPGPGGTGPRSDAKKRVMIQAGHDTGGHSDQPYGHTGESGASGEQAFTKDIRDKVLQLFAQDDRFDAASGNAWSASAGATASNSDDIDAHVDIFVSVHYDRGTAGSGYFFGFNRGATDGFTAAQGTNSQSLADNIATAVNLISGHPPRLTDNANFGGSPANSTGWGYYAWGSTLRASPNDVNHLPGFEAAVIMECGRADDGGYLDTQRVEIATAIYHGICSYYGFSPVG